MLDVHKILSLHGLEDARRLTSSKEERTAIEAAARMRGLSTDDSVVHTSLLTSLLPHKAPKSDARGWRRPMFGGGGLVLEGGFYSNGAPVGIPYGSKARLIIMDLQNQAISGGGPQVSLGPTMHAWLRSAGGDSGGGMTYKLFSDQATRITTCRFSFSDGNSSWRGRIVNEILDCGVGTSLEDMLHRYRMDRTAHPSGAVLDDAFLQATLATRVDVSKAALSCLGNNSAALDLYLTLAACLPSLIEPELITWEALAPSFGVGFRDPSRLRPALLRALQMALAVYPQATVEVVPNGLRLHPSPPPMPGASLS